MLDITACSVRCPYTSCPKHSTVSFEAECQQAKMCDPLHVQHSSAYNFLNTYNSGTYSIGLGQYTPLT